MREIKYYKTENEIEDICVVNGLCKILNDNNLDWSYTSKKSHYLIHCEDFDDEDLIYCDINFKDANNINLSCLRWKDAQISETNIYFQNNVNKIIDLLNNKNSDEFVSAVSMGNYFYTQSIRLQTPKAETKVPLVIRRLSFLGHVHSVTMAENKKNQICFILLPKEDVEIKSIIKPVTKRIVNKDGEEIYITRFRDDKEVEIMATCFIQTIIDLYYLKDKYKQIIIMPFTVSGNNVMPNKFYEVQIPIYSSDLCERLQKILYYSKYDVKDITAKFILFNDYTTFTRLIEIYSKNEQTIDYREELITMYTNNVQRIFNNESVIKIGEKLNYLLYKKKGYELLTRLYTVSNEEQLVNIITGIIDEYQRYLNYSPLNQEEMNGIINLINTKTDARICSKAIIGNAKVFFNKNKNIITEEIN